MKLVRHPLIFGFIGITLYFVTSHNSMADDSDKWVKCGNTNEVMMYYDKTSISRHGDIGSVLTKNAYYNPKMAVRAWCGTRTENCKYKNLQYLQVLNEFDCLAKTSYIKSYTLCDKTGLALGTFDNTDDTKKAIAPDSIDERLFGLVCGKRQ